MSARWLSTNVIPLAGGAAVLCGLMFLGLTGAPPRLLLINLVALGVGFALLALARLIPVPSARPLLLLGSAAALLATALFGVTAEGATRWVVVGGLSLQPSLILLPALLLAHIARSDRWSSLAVAIAALAMALQPDRSLAAAIAAVALVDVLFRRTRAAGLVLAAAVAALAVTVARPDELPAVAHVDQILWTSPGDQPLAALLLWAGTLLLFVPALALRRRGLTVEATAFAALWSTLVLSALLANYPTPLVGYGASCILGYLFTALSLPAARQGVARQIPPTPHVADTSDPHTPRIAVTAP